MDKRIVLTKRQMKLIRELGKNFHKLYEMNVGCFFNFDDYRRLNEKKKEGHYDLTWFFNYIFKWTFFSITYLAHHKISRKHTKVIYGCNRFIKTAMAFIYINITRFFNNVKGFFVVDKDLAISNANQLAKLESRFGVIHKSTGSICSVSDGASTNAYVRHRLVDPMKQNLSLCYIIRWPDR